MQKNAPELKYINQFNPLYVVSIFVTSDAASAVVQNDMPVSNFGHHKVQNHRSAQNMIKHTHTHNHHHHIRAHTHIHIACQHTRTHSCSVTEARNIACLIVINKHNNICTICISQSHLHWPSVSASHQQTCPQFIFLKGGRTTCTHPVQS